MCVYVYIYIYALLEGTAVPACFGARSSSRTISLPIKAHCVDYQERALSIDSWPGVVPSGSNRDVVPPCACFRVPGCRPWRQPRGK